MWNLEIMNQISSLKEKKINILQIGFYQNEESLWLLQNIMKNKNSKLFIMNVWFQLSYNKDMMNNHYAIKIMENTKIEKDFFKDLTNYSKQYINIKQKTEDAFQYFQKEKILFNIILINLDYIQDIITYLISSLNILELNGFLLLSYQLKSIQQIDNILQTFIKIYNENIKIFYFDKYYLIQKISKKNNNIVKDIPLYIEEIVKKYIKDKPFNYNEILPKLDIKDIKYNLIISNYFIPSDKKYGYNYQIEKYIRFINSIYKEYNDIYKIDLLYLTHIKTMSFNYSKPYISKLIRFIFKNDFINKNYKIDLILKQKITYKNSNVINRKKFNMFVLTSLNPKSRNLEFVNYLRKHKNKKIEYYAPINIHSKKNTIKILKNTNQFSIQNNLYNFDEIKNILTNIPTKIDLIQLNLTLYYHSNSNPKSMFFYKNYLYIHFLYLILTIQQKNGELYFICHPFETKVGIQFLQILSTYYSKISMYKSIHYNNHHDICIYASGFKGISQKELKHFYDSYYPFYEKNIKPHIQDMFEGKKIEGLYLDSIFSNPLNPKLIQSVRHFNTQYYKDFIHNIQMKFDIYEFLKNKKNPKKQRDHIQQQITQGQYEKYIEIIKQVQKTNKV
jgi:hypothetical protein